MKEKIKCKGCGKLLKEDEINIKVGDIVIVNTKNCTLSNSGIIEPFCKVCIRDILEDTG